MMGNIYLLGVFIVGVRKRKAGIMTKEKAKCLRPDCTSKANARGLCTSCYQLAQQMVKAGQTTWEKLEATGKAIKYIKPKEQRDAITKSWLLGL